jgi:3-keto-disaccharide hydrolase
MLKRILMMAFALAVAGVALPAPPDQWVQLFNGKDLDGWEHVGPGSMTVENGLIRTHGGMGLLWYTKEKIGDSVLRVVFKTDKPNSNSGVYIRIPEKPTEPWMPVNKGYEVQIDNSDDDYHCTGVLYSLTKAKARPQKPPGEWNTMDITLDGPRTMVTLNGVLITDYTEGQPVPPKKEKWEPDRGLRPNEGYFGLQNHSDDGIVYFREVAVKKLSH